MQPECLQAFAGGALGAAVAAAHDNPPLFEAAHLIAGVIRVDQVVAVEEPEQRQIDLLVPLLWGWAPIAPAALAADQPQRGNGRVAADLLDDVGARPGQRQPGQVAVKDGIDRCGFRRGDRRRRQRDPDERAAPIRALSAPPDVRRNDIPGRGGREHDGRRRRRARPRASGGHRRRLATQSGRDAPARGSAAASRDLCQRHRPVAIMRRIARSAISGSSESRSSVPQPAPCSSRMIARSAGVR